MTTNTVTNIVTISKDPPASLSQAAIAFGVGMVALVVLNCVVVLAMRWLRTKAGTQKDFERESKIGLAMIFAIFEQTLMYLAAVAGREVFGFAVGGWLVLKSTSRFARWQAGHESTRTPEDSELAKKAGLPEDHYAAVMAHPYRYTKSDHVHGDRIGFHAAPLELETMGGSPSINMPLLRS